MRPLIGSGEYFSPPLFLESAGQSKLPRQVGDHGLRLVVGGRVDGEGVRVHRRLRDHRLESRQDVRVDLLRQPLQIAEKKNPVLVRACECVCDKKEIGDLRI